MSTHNITPPHLKSAFYTADNWALGCESGQDSQSSEGKDETRSGSKVAIAALSDVMKVLINCQVILVGSVPQCFSSKPHGTRQVNKRRRSILKRLLKPATWYVMS